jgi:hypothetical protein
MSLVYLVSTETTMQLTFSTSKVLKQNANRIVEGRA